MAKDITNDPQAQAEAKGIKYSTSPARAAELRQKISEAVKYFEHTFGKKLSKEDVLGILRRSVDRDHERVFIKKVEPLSEADIKWFEAEAGLTGGGDEAVEEQIGEYLASESAGGKDRYKPGPGKASGKHAKGKHSGKAESDSDLNGEAEGEAFPD